VARKFQEQRQSKKDQRDSLAVRHKNDDPLQHGITDSCLPPQEASSTSKYMESGEEIKGRLSSVKRNLLVEIYIIILQEASKSSRL
jgi:hypothetical protein